MNTKSRSSILQSACFSAMLACGLVCCANADAQSTANASTNSLAARAEPVMTEELMKRLIKCALSAKKPSTLTWRICKVFNLCDGNEDMKVKTAKSDSADGDHYFAIPDKAGLKDIFIVVEYDKFLEAYLTDKTGTLRAAAILDPGGASLITNEKAAKKFEAELALFAKEAADLPPTQTTDATAAAELPQWRGQTEGDSEFSTRTIKTQESWARFWTKVGKPQPRALDETREMAVFIAVGERPTGGFKPQIVSATIRDEKLVVVYTDGKPSADAIVTQAITHPWVIAIVPQTSLPVETKEQSTK